MLAINTTDNPMFVISLDIDPFGQAKTRIPDLEKSAQLHNTLLQGLFPDIRVARLNIPGGVLDESQQALVEQTMKRVNVDGVQFRLVGASGSAKDGKFYAVEAKYERAIAERFLNWPQAAITYFGVLVSPCKVRIEASDMRVIVVKDHDFGTNDCRGWISRSVFQALQQRSRAKGWDLPGDRLYQFRLAFDSTQAKGACKVMEDDVAEFLGADIILPESSVKPEYKGPSRLLDLFRSQIRQLEVRTYRGPVVFGIREVSEPREFESSYTLLEHASWETLKSEILPHALSQVQKLKTAAEEGNYEGLLELLGTSQGQQRLESDDNGESGFTSRAATVVEAVLKVDPTGYLVKHPYINQQLNKLLARWTFKLCTGGGFRMPAFALADDGILALHDGQVIAASDWLPLDRAVTSLSSDRGLVVRYPIRMFEDLLPYRRIAIGEMVSEIARTVQQQAGVRVHPCQIVDLFEGQIFLKGTLTLHSKTAARNGGDFDFDMVCVVEGEKLPGFVKDRFSLKEQTPVEKEKLKKQKSPWWNLVQVASKAKGNEIGSITDLQTSCMAAGQPELAYELVRELQNALDSLKHGTQVDRERIAEIRKRIKTAPWLKYKREDQVSRMPVSVEIEPTDKVGYLYNAVRKEVDDFFRTTLPISDFHGVITRGVFTQEMFEECREINRLYAAEVSRIMTRKSDVEKQFQESEAEFEAQRSTTDGKLNLLPFDALKDESGKYILESHVITYAPSATTLHLLREPQDVDGAAMNFLGVGDAIQPESNAATTKRAEMATTDFFDLDAANFPYLPGSRQELTSVAEIIRGPNHLLLGTSATESALKALPLGDFRVIHLAVHGVVNTQFPDRAALVLSKSSDSSEDGLLQVREIRDLELNAELIVLSACDTGNGKLLGGEGIASLERAFLLAGAKSVIASLWAADDIYTIALMKRLYEHLVAGRDKGAALRQAKLDLLKEFSDEAFPVYWAGFTLVGDGSVGIFP